MKRNDIKYIPSLSYRQLPTGDIYGVIWWLYDVFVCEFFEGGGALTQSLHARWYGPAADHCTSSLCNWMASQSLFVARQPAWWWRRADNTSFHAHKWDI